MARFNEILAGRFNRALQKLTSMKGGPPAPQLASEISINFQFNQMGADFRYLEGWNKFAATIVQPASVGNTSAFRLRNPAASNVIVVIEKIIFITSLAQAAYFGQLLEGGAVTDLTSAAVVSNMDTRGNPSSVSIVSAQNTTAVVPALSNQNVIDQFVMATNTQLDVINHEDQQIPLLPGSALQAFPNAVNTDFRVTIWWRERFLEDSERT